jgi:hypothetical protein
MKNLKTMLRILIVILIILILLLGYQFFTITEKKEESTDMERTVHPALYQACDEDSCIYLLGTIHMADKSLKGLTDTIWKAYEESDYLAVEIDINAYEESGEEYYLEEDDDLSNYLTEEQLSLLEDFCKRHLLSFDTMRTLKLSYVAEVLSVWADVELNLISQYGVDQQLLNQAYQDEKEIIELETYEFQKNLLYGFSDEWYASELESTIRDFQYLKFSTQYLYNCYVGGNTWLLNQLLDEDSSDEETQEYNNKMVTERNKNMSDLAEGFLKENKKVLIAVGTAHVLGDTGLVKTLQERGYQVSLVK